MQAHSVQLLEGHEGHKAEAQTAVLVQVGGHTEGLLCAWGFAEGVQPWGRGLEGVQHRLTWSVGQGAVQSAVLGQLAGIS